MSRDEDLPEGHKAADASHGNDDIVGRHYAARRRSDRDEYRSSHLWLVSFTDVMALMLTFFVLLFAMSKPENQSWEDMTDALQTHLSRFEGVSVNRGPQEDFDPSRINYNRALDLTYLKAVFEDVVRDEPALGVVSIIPQADHLILSLPEDLLFETGSVEVREEGIKALYALGGTLFRIKNRVEVIGHTDPRPVSGQGGEYANNWELSLARAASVAGVLRSVGYEQSVIVRGLASGRYSDLRGVIQDEGERRDLSRRVDILVMNHDGIKRKSFFSIGFP